jgi:hypothetical protein
MNIIERHLQLCLKKIEKWAMDNAFEFSSSKTIAMHFCNKGGLYPDQQLQLCNSLVQKIPETKFSVSFLIVNLPFYLILKCLKIIVIKALNILKYESSIEWLRIARLY